MGVAVASEVDRSRARPRLARLAAATRTAVLQVLVVVALVGLWQLAHELKLVRPLVLSSPGEVWHAFRGIYREHLLWTNLWSTVEATLVALGLAGVVGIAIGLGLALVPSVERVAAPFVTAFNSAPRIAFAPVFIIAFGINQSAKVALAFSVVVFVMIIAARAGVHAADPDVIRLMQVQGATRRQVFLKLLLPVAVPSIFAGLRLGLIYSLLGVVTSEMIAARAGMGQLVARYAGNFQLAEVYAVIIVLIVVATILNTISGVVERRLLWWMPPAGGGR